MILTREKQEEIINEYLKTHTAKETEIFIAGMNKIIEVINKNIK